MMVSTIGVAQDVTIDKPLRTNINAATKAFASNNFGPYFKLYAEWEKLLKQSNDIQLKAESIYKYSSQLRKLNLHEECIELVNMLTQLKRNALANRWWYLSYTNKAISENVLGKHKEALKTYRANLALSLELEKRHRASALNHMGLQFENFMHNRDSALYYYEQSLNVLKTNRIEGPLFATVNGNLAGIYIKQGKYKAAQERIAENHYRFFKLDTIDRIKSKHLNSGINLAKTYILTKDYKKTDQLLTDLKAKIDTATFKNPRFKRNTLLRWLEVNLQLYTAQNNTAKALEFSNAIIIEKDRLNTLFDKEQQIVTKGLEGVAIEKYQTQIQNEQLKLESEKQKSQIRFWVTTFILTVILVLFIVLYYRYKQRAKLIANKKALAEQKARAKTLENQLLQQNIELQKKDLSNLALNNQQYQDWLQQLNAMVKDLRLYNGTEREKTIQALETNIKQKNRINAFTNELQNKVEQINTNFYEKLKTSFPLLTPRELKLCAFLRIDLDSNHIASLFNISPDSVNKSRYRLRKKLQLETSQDLESFLKTY